MKITALIPARKNSERFPGKNFALFLGKPLFLHSVDFAKNSELITEYVVTTNDDYIINHCQNNNIPYLQRPDVYSQATSRNTAYVYHFLSQLIEKKVELPEALLILQPTDPVRKHSFLRDIVKLYCDEYADCVFTVVRCKTKMGRIIDGVFTPFNYHFEQRFQDMESYFEENGMFYLINVSSFLKNNSFFGAKNLPYEIPEHYKSMDIDTKLELDIAEFIFKNLDKNELNQTIKK